jgi:hypothetical protein
MPSGSDNALAVRVASEIQELHEKAQLCTLEITQGIELSSNDYLGLARDPRLKAAPFEAVQQSAARGSTGSRLLSRHSREWADGMSQTQYCSDAQNPGPISDKVLNHEELAPSRNIAIC